MGRLISRGTGLRPLALTRRGDSINPIGLYCLTWLRRCCSQTRRGTNTPYQGKVFSPAQNGLFLSQPTTQFRRGADTILGTIIQEQNLPPQGFGFSPKPSPHNHDLSQSIYPLRPFRSRAGFVFGIEAGNRYTGGKVVAFVSHPCF